MFKLTNEQTQELEKWENAQSDESYAQWYEDQKKNADDIKLVLEKAAFESGKSLSLDELYEIARLVRENLGNTQLQITGENQYLSQTISGLSIIS